MKLVKFSFNFHFNIYTTCYLIGDIYIYIPLMKSLDNKLRLKIINKPIVIYLLF